MMLKVVLLSALLGLTHAKSGKSFSLFNVVTFSNDDCVSDSSSTGSPSGFRNGTCYTAEECTEKGGEASGPCASGFGTCCLFAYSECGKEVSQNNSYVRNEGFPTAVTTSGNCNYKIKKCADNICTLRLDFDSFSILAGTSTDGKEDEFFDCQDTFTVTGLATRQNIPTICGMNAGQHIYVELGMAASSTATLNFAFSSEVFNRNFEIKVTQYACEDPNRPPVGCLQYHTGTQGRFTSFNFAADLHHLNDQAYNVCLRQEAGFCCVRYHVCDDDSSFTLDDEDDDTSPNADHGTDCTDDYIEIEGSSNVCNGKTFYNRYCGDALSTDSDTNIDTQSSICDCTAPFQVSIVTNSALDDSGIALNDSEDDKNRGLCLNYVQQAC